VEWYDLQSNWSTISRTIETQWQENPKVTFDQALNTEFKFGVFGFMDVVEKTTSRFK
jgi:hypothetical protein